MTPDWETVFAIAFHLIVGGTALLTLAIAARQIVITVAALRPRADRPETKPAIARHDLPSVAVMIPAHNEEAVIGDSLEAIARTDYPQDRFEVIVIDDRSSDRTGAIIDAAAARHPAIRPLHRKADARPGKSAALKEAMELTDAEIIVFFDADYLPGPGLVRKLVEPFSDPRIGATMGRVVPANPDANLLTRLIDLERRAGYVVDQQMRDRWNLLPQFGGTTGGIRASALREIGGWQEGLMTEDTFITYALFLAGYDVAYLNEAACYEESPETWQARFKQVRRWAYGHNECLFAFFGPVLTARGQSPARRLDAALVLLFYLYPVLACVSLPLALIGPSVASVGYGWMYLGLFPLLTGFGNLSPFFQIAAAARLDGQPHVLRYAPLLMFSSLITMLAAASGFLQLVWNTALRRQAVWDKTARFRSSVSRISESTSRVRILYPRRGG